MGEDFPHLLLQAAAASITVQTESSSADETTRLIRMTVRYPFLLKSLASYQFLSHSFERKQKWR